MPFLETSKYLNINPNVKRLNLATGQQQLQENNETDTVNFFHEHANVLASPKTIPQNKVSKKGLRIKKQDTFSTTF